MKIRALLFSLLLFVSVSVRAGNVEAPGVAEPPADSTYSWWYDVVTSLWYIVP
jgi:hypothetical protein